MARRNGILGELANTRPGSRAAMPRVRGATQNPDHGHSSPTIRITAASPTVERAAIDGGSGPDAAMRPARRPVRIALSTHRCPAGDASAGENGLRGDWLPAAPSVIPAGHGSPAGDHLFAIVISSTPLATCPARTETPHTSSRAVRGHGGSLKPAWHLYGVLNKLRLAPGLKTRRVRARVSCGKASPFARIDDSHLTKATGWGKNHFVRPNGFNSFSPALADCTRPRGGFVFLVPGSPSGSRSESCSTSDAQRGIWSCIGDSRQSHGCFQMGLRLVGGYQLVSLGL